MKEIILITMKEVAENYNCQLTEDINNDTVLLESGLDSLGFAILVASLEEKLGIDPFAVMENAVYPKTLGDFIDIYKNSNDA